MISESLLSACRYPSLQRAQWKSRESLDAIQWRRFKAILQFAYTNSPFYRQRLDEASVTPDEIQSRSDLDRIPITTREDLRDPERLICTGYRRQDLNCSLTTGSTGRRTRSYFDDRAWILAKYLLKMRARMATGVSPFDRIALLQESETAASISAVRERLFRLRSFSIDLPTRSLLEQLLEFNPTVLYGFPSHLQRLAEEEDGDLGVSRVYTSGETLIAEVRRRIEEAFGAQVLDVYGCTEVKEIAWQCREQSGYHINSDWILVEVLQYGSTGGPEGDIVLTALYNRAMPIIRYQVGDTGALIEEPCSCGRGLPMMRPTGGRSVDYFETPGGTSVSPYAMSFAMEQVQGLRQFQIIQLATDRVKVKAVAAPGLARVIPREVQSRLGNLLSGMVIEVDLVDRIETDRNGKFRIVSSRVGAAE